MLIMYGGGPVADWPSWYNCSTSNFLRGEGPSTQPAFSDFPTSRVPWSIHLQNRLEVLTDMAGIS